MEILTSFPGHPGHSLSETNKWVFWRKARCGCLLWLFLSRGIPPNLLMASVLSIKKSRIIPFSLLQGSRYMGSIRHPACWSTAVSGSLFLVVGDTGVSLSAGLREPGNLHVALLPSPYFGEIFFPVKVNFPKQEVSWIRICYFFWKDDPLSKKSSMKIWYGIFHLFDPT